MLALVPRGVSPQEDTQVSPTGGGVSDCIHYRWRCGGTLKEAVKLACGMEIPRERAEGWCCYESIALSYIGASGVPVVI